MEDLEQKVKQIIAEQLGKNEADIKTSAPTALTRLNS